MSGQNEVNMMDAIINLRETLAIAEQNVSDLKELRDEKELELYEHMEAKGVKSLSSKTHSITCIKPRVFASVLAEDRQRLLQWIDDEQGRPDLILHTVHHQTLSKYISDDIYGKGIEPPDFVKVYTKKTIQIRKKGETTHGSTK